MKGLNCYTPFWVAGGTKKSLTPDQAKGGFFVPCDIVDVPRAPFFQVAGAELCSRLHHEVPRSAPAPVFSFAYFFIQSGLRRRSSVKPGHSPLAVRSYFLYRCFHSLLPVCLVFLLTIFGCSQTPSAARTPPCTWEHFIVAPDIIIDVTNKVGPPKPVDTDFWMNHNWPNLPFPLEFYGSDDDNHKPHQPHR